MMDMYGFYTGREFEAYKWLGAHIEDGGVVFRTFAPGAAGVELVLEGNVLPMERVQGGQFYEAFSAAAKEGDRYEYRIHLRDGRCVDHADPYGFGMELRPAHKSIVRDLRGYEFGDRKWMNARSDRKDKALNIYEMHLGSWRRKHDGGEGWYSYDEIAEPLIAYLKDSGYNYVEFLPLSEHPMDASWGYQNTGFYAPTSRYGTMDGLKKLIDLLHRSGIGAILDFVPVHFAVDEYGLALYDGAALYEYPHSDVGVSEWGSYNFMHSRGEVRSFLQSNANYWLSEYHFDGLRMDAISRIIYWQGDERRGVNGNAVDFIRVMNAGLKERNPGCLLTAEDSTSYAGVTRPANQGGLGFDYKWDMGWMHDTLEYFQSPAEERTEKYHKLTFSMMYFRNENYLLPLSHDEVVHGKATILQKMSGAYDDKFPQGRAMYLYMAVHPGKKLNFMGNEFGQLREWDESRQQDWNLFDYPLHAAFYRFMADLNKLYLEHPAFSEKDYEEEGFSWIDCHQEARCIYAVERKSGNERLAAVFNFSGVRQEDYCLKAGIADPEILIHSDWIKYGGGTEEGDEGIFPEGEDIRISLPRYSGLIIRDRAERGGALRR